MTDLHIDHLLLRYDPGVTGGERLRDIVGRAVEIAAARLDEGPRAEPSPGPLRVDFATMPNETIAALLAEMLVMKVEAEG